MSTVAGVGGNYMASLRSVMVPGQYKNSYCMGTHKGDRPCLRHAGPVKQWMLRRCSVADNQKSGNPCSKQSSAGYALDEAPQANDKQYALNIHGSRNGDWDTSHAGIADKDVNGLSHGCQVFGDKAFLNEVLPIVFSSLLLHTVYA